MIPANATTCASATAQGQVCWEEDAGVLWIGNGSAAVGIGPGVGTGDVIDVGNCASGACFDGSSDGGSALTWYNVSANATQTWNGTAMDFNQPVTATSFTADAVAAPGIDLDDSDSASEAIDAQISANATDVEGS